MVLLKTIIFTFLVPGTVTVLVPYWLLSSPSSPQPMQLGVFRYFGVLPTLVGTAIYFWCALGILRLPVEEHLRQLIRQKNLSCGLYRYVRNPMYVGILSILLGEALLFASGDCLNI